MACCGAEGPWLRDLEAGLPLRNVGERTVRQADSVRRVVIFGCPKTCLVERLRHLTWNRHGIPTGSESRLRFASPVVIKHPCCQEAAPFGSHSKSDRVSRSKEVTVSYQAGLDPPENFWGCSGIAKYRR